MPALNISLTSSHWQSLSQSPSPWHPHAINCSQGTGKKQDIKITGASTLSDSDVDRMVKDAEKFAAEDEAKKKVVETKNQVRGGRPTTAPGHVAAG